ncbi:MAG: hypothetical protein IJ730_01040 [Alphaproteobacteria bacterium]|nr:hypothetical protein [Alphaproteobacteria bacterium]
MKTNIFINCFIAGVLSTGAMGLFSETQAMNFEKEAKEADFFVSAKYSPNNDNATVNFFKGESQLGEIDWNDGVATVNVAEQNDLCNLNIVLNKNDFDKVRDCKILVQSQVTEASSQCIFPFSISFCDGIVIAPDGEIDNASIICAFDTNKSIFIKNPVKCRKIILRSSDIFGCDNVSGTCQVFAVNNNTSVASSSSSAVSSNVIEQVEEETSSKKGKDLARDGLHSIADGIGTVATAIATSGDMQRLKKNIANESKKVEQRIRKLFRRH